MKNRILFILLCSTMCLLLAGCAEKTADESQLRADLYSSDAFSEYANDRNMEITDLEIVKRQTDEAQKVDAVWIRANAASEEVEAEMYYVMTYNLYNDGWLLESVEDDEIDSWCFVPLQGVSDDVIANDLQYFSNYEILNNELDLEQGRQTITFTYEETHLYCTITSTEQLIYEFENAYYDFGTAYAGEWGSSFVTLDSSTVWNVCGTYQNSDGEILHIEKFDTDGIFVYSSFSGKSNDLTERFFYRWNNSQTQSDIMVEIGDITAKEYFAELDYATQEYIGMYGYSVSCDNFIWYDISFATLRGYYIGYDHIYYGPDYHITSGTRTIHMTMDDEFTRIG